MSEQYQQLPEGTEITEAIQRQLEFARRLREFATTHVDEVRRADTTQFKTMERLRHAGVRIIFNP